MSKLLRLAVVGAIVLAAPAAWAIAGTDPNDTIGGIDVLRSSANLVTRADGRVRLVLRAEVQNPLHIAGGDGSIYWQLDTRGDDERDYEVFVFGDPEANDPAGPLYCLVQKPNGTQQHYVHVSVNDTVARCAIPRWLLTIKGGDVHYRLAGRLHGVIDRAPDTGWY
jgi:hypothetical protein